LTGPSIPGFPRCLAALMRGLELPASSRSGIHYCRLECPFVDCIGTIRAETLRLGAALTVVDSFHMAIGTQDGEVGQVAPVEGFQGAK